MRCVLGVVLFLMCLTANALGVVDIQNAGFETGTTTGWTLGPGTLVVDVEVVTEAQAFDGTIFAPTEGQYMLRLIAGSSVTEIWQDLVGFEPGDQIVFDWAFLGMDAMPYNDGSRSNLTETDAGFGKFMPLAEIFLVGNYGHSGWNAGSISVDDATKGRISFQVFNGLDTANESVLLVDNVRILHLVPEPITAMTVAMSFGIIALVALRRQLSR